MPRHHDVLYLVVRYLQAEGLFSSALMLQQESGLDVTWLRGPARELALLRRWVFDGDVARARAMLQPLESVGGEFEAARLALDELEVVLRATRSRGKPGWASRLSNTKAKCFETMVPLFRAPIDADESEVLKYVAMPALQLVGLIHDAVLFHRQCGDDAHDCISVVCSATASDGKDSEGEEVDLLLLDRRLEVRGFEYEQAVDTARSVDWTRQRRRRQNSVLSMSTSNRPWFEDGSSGGEADEMIEEGVARRNVSIVKETADAAVSCMPEEKETVDVAVNCEPEEKETTDGAVNCGPDGWSHAATQTESADSLEGWEADPSLDAAGEDQIQCGEMDGDSTGVESAKEQAGFDESYRCQYEQGNQHEDESASLSASSVVSSKCFSESWGRANSRSFAGGVLDQPVVDQEEGCCRLKELLVEVAPSPAQDNTEQLHQECDEEAGFDAEIPSLKGPPVHYDDLSLESVVRASVIAEVKEPQAVRALDVHPSGAQLAVGTNARALRVFDLSTPLQQRQQHVSWSSPLNLLLPLLPVSLERHKHHNSGIYCVAYNRYLARLGSRSMIASGAADGSVKVLITRDKDPLQRQQAEELWVQRGDVSGSMGKTRALEFASPHLLWACSTNDRRLQCWDVRRTQRSSSSGPHQTLDGHVGEIQAIAMPQPPTSGSASTMLLSAALDKTVRLWDARSQRCERLVASGAHAAFSLHFHPTDEKLVLSGHQDGGVSLWDLRSTAREALQVVVPHQDECRSVRWSPGGHWVLSAAFDGTLCIMEATAATLQPVASYHKHYGKVLQAQWHPTEPAFVSSGADKRVKLWAFA